MKAIAKALILTVSLALLAPACLVHEVEPGYETVAISVRRQPRCHPSRYWDGERCVRKHRHYRHHHDHLFFGTP